MRAFSPLAVLIVYALTAGCPEESGPAGARDSAAGAPIGLEPTVALAFAGREPDRVPPPGPGGPFVEPPLHKRPSHLYLVVAGRSAMLSALAGPMRRLAAVPAVPIGYPAVDRSAGQGGYILVAGKFARQEWARTLVEALARAGWDTAEVVTRRYRFDRHKPALNEGPYPRAGRVFAGVPGVEVPLLTLPRPDAAGAGRALADGSLVAVTGEERAAGRLWYRVEQGEFLGFLPAGRVLLDANLFAASTGRRAVLGVGLGCHQGRCRWDYWLVGPGYGFRRLLKSAGERMPHAFSPDGRWLAYTTFDPSILVVDSEGSEGQGAFALGPGTSPSFSPDGRLLYFRGPGVRGRRDEVLVSEVASWAVSDNEPKIKKILDFKGDPYYPRAISAVPSQVDFSPGDQELFTLFYRLAQKKDRKKIHRWGVRFTPDGRILEKAGVVISE